MTASGISPSAVETFAARERELFLAPVTNTASVDVEPERRTKSIYETVVYEARVKGTARFALPEDLARLKPGDVFMFAGRLLELVRTQQMTAYVRTAPKGSAALPRWNGGRMPLSNTLADAMLRQLEQLGVQVEVVAEDSPRCTLENEGLSSHRRDPSSGRIAGIVVPVS